MNEVKFLCAPYKKSKNITTSLFFIIFLILFVKNFKKKKYDPIKFLKKKTMLIYEFKILHALHKSTKIKKSLYIS